jgi:hypothetical protein
MHLRLPAGYQFFGAPEPIAASLTRYLECAAGTRKANTVASMAGRLGHLVRTVADIDPAWDTLAALDRQRHIEPYLVAVGAAVNPRTGANLSASERRSRILTAAISPRRRGATTGGWRRADDQRGFRCQTH